MEHRCPNCELTKEKVFDKQGKVRNYKSTCGSQQCLLINKSIWKEKIRATAKEKGCGKWMIGRRLSEETKRKIGQKSLGHKLNAESRMKISNRLRGENNGKWNGGKSPYKRAPVALSGDKRRDIHRILMEEKIGRLLKIGEIVHHINGDRCNNSKENLILLRNHYSHKRLHDFARRHDVSIGLLKFDQPWLNVV